MRRREVSLPKLDQNDVPIGEIHTIVGGLTSGVAFASGRKAYSRRARYEEVFNVGRKPKMAT